MIDHTYRVRLTTGTILHVVASKVQIEGDHLAFVGAIGNLSALFIAELVGSWKMLPDVAAGKRCRFSPHFGNDSLPANR